MAIQRGTTWQANVRLLNGKRLRPGGFPTLPDAELWEAQARAADARGETVPPASSSSSSSRGTSVPLLSTLGIPLGDLRKQVLAYPAPEGWKGTKDEDGAGERSWLVVKFFGENKRASAIDETEVGRLVTACQQAGNSNKTINRKLAALSKMLRFGRTFRLIPEPPRIRRVAEGEGRIRFLTRPEEERLLAQLELDGQHDVRLLVMFLIDSGARISEALNLTHADWGDRATFWVTKGGKARTVPLTKRAKAACQRFARNDKAGPFSGMSYSTIKAAFSKAVGRCGLGTDVVIHTLRHTCATRLVLKFGKNDILRIKRWMGHTSIETTQKYIHLCDEDLDDMVATLEEPDDKRTKSVVSDAVEDVPKLVPKRAQMCPKRPRSSQLSH